MVCRRTCGVHQDQQAQRRCAAVMESWIVFHVKLAFRGGHVLPCRNLAHRSARIIDMSVSGLSSCTSHSSKAVQLCTDDPANRS